MNVVNLILGGILLVLGRRFFWLFVGILGFIAGLNLAERLLTGKPLLLIIFVAIVAGFIGAGIAIFLQRLAIAVSGFLAGGYILINALMLAGAAPGNLEWVWFVVGGVIGAILVTALFDWALIVLSSLTGANLIVQVLSPNPSTQAFWLLLLAAVGIVIQALLMQRSRQMAPVKPA